MTWKTAFVPPRLAAPVTSASFKEEFAPSVNSWTYPAPPNGFTFPAGGDTTAALNPFRFQAPWNAAAIASVGAPPPTSTTGVGTFNCALAVPLTVGSNVLVAVTVTVWVAVIVLGAVYLPVSS